jgi:hypothetical protein
MAIRNTDTSECKNNFGTFSSDSKSILTIDILLENKRSTCSSEDQDDTPITNNFDSRSMVTISSWHSRSIKRKIEHFPIEDKKCECVIY